MSNVNKQRRAYMLENLGFDYILDEYNAPNFYEMVISIGGDVCRYRCYGESKDDFSIYCK